MSFKRIISSQFIRSVFAVASGTALAQVVVVAFSPLITRIYGPEVFGLQGVFLSLISVFGPLIALRYPMAIITADSDNEALKIARLSMYVAGVIASALWIILYSGGETIATLLGSERFGNLILFLPLALLGVAFQDVSDYRAARLGAFRLFGIASVIQSFVINLARVLGGLWSPIAAILIVVTTVAPVVRPVLLMMLSRELRPRTSVIAKPEAITLLKKHHEFAVYRAPTDVVNSASQAAPVILLSVFFEPEAAGFYVLTRSVLNLPMNVLAGSLGNVIYARFGELQRSSQALFPLLVKATLSLLCLAPIIIALGWFAPPFFAFVFGAEWEEAGRYAQWMALWLGVSVANVPAVKLSAVIGAQHVLLVANVVILAARFLSIFTVTWLSGSALDAIAAYSVVSLFANLLLVIVLFRRCAQHDDLNRDRSPRQ